MHLVLMAGNGQCHFEMLHNDLRVYLNLSLEPWEAGFHFQFSLSVFFFCLSFPFLFIHLFQLKLRAFYPELKVCVVNSRSWLPQYLHLVGNKNIKIFYSVNSQLPSLLSKVIVRKTEKTKSAGIFLGMELSVRNTRRADYIIISTWTQSVPKLLKFGQ